MEKGLTVQHATPATLLEKAIDKGVDIAQLKELMDLQDRWEKKEARKSFLDALSKFQTMVPELKKSKTAKINSQKGNFTYKYADLGSITKAIKNALNDCGLSYRWEFDESNEKMKVTCLISHRDGHTETTSMEGGRDSSGAKNDIQQKGSTHTYLQRYTLIGALGLSTADEDNDGKSVNGKESDHLSDEDIKQQWKDAIAGTRSKIELRALYVKNQKTVDADPELQKMFGDRQEVLKKSQTTNTVMP